jgi:hypothetical protein
VAAESLAAEGGVPIAAGAGSGAGGAKSAAALGQAVLAGFLCALLNRVCCGLCHASNGNKDSGGPARNGTAAHMTR